MGYIDFTVHDLLTPTFQARAIYPRLKLKLLGIRV